MVRYNKDNTNTMVPLPVGDVLGLGGYIGHGTIFCTKNGAWVGEYLGIYKCMSTVYLFPDIEN